MLKSKAKWNYLKDAATNDILDSETVIDRLFAARGLDDAAEREKFLQPKLENLEDPKYLNGIEAVKERIEQALEMDERVVIYGDYDADGVTATTVLVKTLQKLGIRAEFYIPNRFTDGYGISERAIEHFAEQNVDLIITVDTGIANVDEVQFANDLGIDIIITDHHEVQETLPDAYAIIHPALSKNYSYKTLAGVGVAFQVAHYLL